MHLEHSYVCVCGETVPSRRLLLDLISFLGTLRRSPLQIGQNFTSGCGPGIFAISNFLFPSPGGRPAPRYEASGAPSFRLVYDCVPLATVAILISLPVDIPDTSGLDEIQVSPISSLRHIEDNGTKALRQDAFATTLSQQF